MDGSATTTTVDLTRKELYELAKALSLRIAAGDRNGTAEGGVDAPTERLAALLTKLLDAHARLTVDTWTNGVDHSRLLPLVATDPSPAATNPS